MRLHSATRRSAAALLAGALVACANKPRTGVFPEAATFDFTAATTVDTVLTGSFSGTGTVRGQSIDVVLSSGSISFPPGEAMRWRGVELHAFLAAEYSSRSWTAPVESRPTILWPYLGFPPKPLLERTSVRLLRPLRFQVPIPAGTDLSRARLAVEIEWVALYTDPSKPDLRYGQQESNIAFSGPLVLTPAKH